MYTFTQVRARAHMHDMYIDDVNKRAKWSSARDKRNTRPLPPSSPIVGDALVFDRARADGWSRGYGGGTERGKERER